MLAGGGDSHVGQHSQGRLPRLLVGVGGGAGDNVGQALDDLAAVDVQERLAGLRTRGGKIALATLELGGGVGD